MDMLQPLMDAVVSGEENLVEIYLQLGANIIMSSKEGYTVLHWAAASSDGERLVTYLINKGADMNLPDHHGYSPLHLHALRGRVYGVSSLLHAGADPNITTVTDKFTPLHLAVMHNHIEVVNVLLAFGADPGAATAAGLTVSDMGLNFNTLTTSSNSTAAT